MARLFTKNVSNYMVLGTNVISPLVAGSAQISFSVWLLANSIDASANNNRILTVCQAANTSSLVLATDASSHFRLGGRSVSTDGFQTANSTSTIPIGRRIHVGGVFDFAAKTITPYFNGTAEGAASVTWANTTFTNGAHTTDVDAIGSGLQTGPPPVATTGQWDGAIEKLTMWKANIGAANFARLANGADARFLNPGLVFYMPLQGTYSPEIDIVSLVKGTITGSIPSANRIARGTLRAA